ncbi:hypothetical protein SAMN05660443_0627 [Marinospirillum celere]|uniref:Uncharacterized protein n=1 Tax=Marinospirillum celere TaxID=1122252 RepID=A0A1I1EI72_9GAMM|nr:hypothetical protein [Marinospirillum celere]SFB86825.1 hypothetical protein SAMN05660443_0627 [Marinospirillum celere]
MNYTINGYYVKQKRGLSHWPRLLEEWVLQVERYCRVYEGQDAPYLYTEQANVGLIASAAWRSGGIALEEFQSVKGVKHRPKWNGRIDLWLCQDEKTEEIVEAKMLKISMDAHTDLISSVSKCMAAAVKDAKSAKASYELTGLGAVFVVPNLTIKRALSRMESEETPSDWIEAWVDEVLAGNDYHAAAWCFPKEMRNQLLSDNPDICGDNYAYPGVILLLKNCDR